MFVVCYVCYETYLTYVMYVILCMLLCMSCYVCYVMYVVMISCYVCYVMYVVLLVNLNIHFWAKSLKIIKNIYSQLSKNLSFLARSKISKISLNKVMLIQVLRLSEIVLVYAMLLHSIGYVTIFLSPLRQMKDQLK